MGKTVSPIEPSETMYTLQNGFINAGFIFLALAILATLIFGRYICGWGCHILALQDFCGWLLKKMGLHPKPFRSRLLVYVPLIGALYMFVWPVVYRLFSAPARTAYSQIHQSSGHHQFLADVSLRRGGHSVSFRLRFHDSLLSGAKRLLHLRLSLRRIFGLADKLSPGKIRVTPACNQCGHCTATCTSNVLVHAEVKQYGMVVDPGCMKCMDCVSVCPNDALYFGFGKPSILVPKSDAIKRSYSLTWPEEIVGVLVFLGSFLAVRGVYALVPFLMALGCATVTTFLTLKTWRLFRAKELSFYRFNLKSAGKDSESRLGVCSLRVCLDWIECSQRLDPLSRGSAATARFRKFSCPTSSPSPRSILLAGLARLTGKTSSQEKNIFRLLRSWGYL